MELDSNIARFQSYCSLEVGDLLTSCDLIMDQICIIELLSK